MYIDELIGIYFDESEGGGNPEADAPEPTDGQDNPEADPPKEKLLSQSEVNAIVAREKKKAEKAAREALEAERKKAEMTEAERHKTEKEEADKARQAAEARAIRAERKAALKGEVADPEAALRLLDEEKHLDGDGNVNVKALLESYPFLAPAKTTPSLDGPNPAGGGRKTFTDEQLRKMSPDEINANWDDILASRQKR